MSPTTTSPSTTSSRRSSPRDTAAALAGVAAATAAGRDARTLAERLVAQLRDGFLSLFAPELVDLPDRAAERVADQAKRLGAAATVRALEVLGETLVDFRHAPDPRLLLDVALVRLTNAASRHVGGGAARAASSGSSASARAGGDAGARRPSGCRPPGCGATAHDAGR